MKKTVLGLTLLLATSALAAKEPDLWISTTLGAKHWDDSRPTICTEYQWFYKPAHARRKPNGFYEACEYPQPLNNDVFGVGIEVKSQWEDVRWTAGYIDKNSYGRHTAYVGVSWTPLRLGPVRGGATVNLCTGYEESNVCPALLLSYEHDKRVGVNFVYLPGHNADALVLQLKIAVK